MKRIFSTILFLLPFSLSTHAALLRVPLDFATIQSAVDSASDGDIVLVADGTYSGSGNRDINTSGKHIIISSLNGPDATIIDAQRTDNHRLFLFTNGETRQTIINGFTLTGGYQRSNSERPVGGAVLCEESSPTFINCRFETNQVSGFMVANGGAVYTKKSDPIFVHCEFAGNSAEWSGGALFISEGIATFTNCLFYNNRATVSDGGAICCGHLAGVDIRHSTITGNSAAAGGALSVGFSIIEIESSILWGNYPDQIYDQFISTYKIQYSDIQGGFTGEGNINADPQFAIGPKSDYYLSHPDAGQSILSPCADTGFGEAAETCNELLWGLVPLSTLTTRTDELQDSGVSDMGYHHFSSDYRYLGIHIDMPESIHPGENFWIQGYVWNQGNTVYSVPVCFFLQIVDEFWFWPSWSQEQIDYKLIDVNNGVSSIEVLPAFEWPDLGNATATDLWFHGGLLNSERTKLVGCRSARMWGFAP